MKKKEFEKLNLGVYRVYWKSGGSSLATIGMTFNGDRWIAPSNWTFPARVSKSIRKAILKVEKIGTKQYQSPIDTNKTFL